MGGAPPRPRASTSHPAPASTWWRAAARPVAWAIWQPVVMRERRARRQPEQLGQPAADDLLGHGGGRRGDVQAAFWSHAEASQSAASAAGSEPPNTKPKKRGDWLAMRPGPAASTSASSTARGSDGPSGNGPPSAARRAAGSISAGPTRPLGQAVEEGRGVVGGRGQEVSRVHAPTLSGAVRPNSLIPVGIW